jgi:hypothetical protein
VLSIGDSDRKGPSSLLRHRTCTSGGSSATDGSSSGECTAAAAAGTAAAASADAPRLRLATMTGRCGAHDRDGRLCRFVQNCNSVYYGFVGVGCW